MGAQAAAARLRDTLAEMRAAPVLLLVHDEPAARAALHDLGIQTSTWASGVDALLRSVRAFPRPRLPGFLTDITLPFLFSILRFCLILSRAG